MKKYLIIISLWVALLFITTISNFIINKDNNRLIGEIKAYEDQVTNKESENELLKKEEEDLLNINKSKIEEYEKWKKRVEEIKKMTEEN